MVHQVAMLGQVLTRNSLSRYTVFYDLADPLSPEKNTLLATYVSYFVITSQTYYFLSSSEIGLMCRWADHKALHSLAAYLWRNSISNDTDNIIDMREPSAVLASEATDTSNDVTSSDVILSTEVFVLDSELVGCSENINDGGVVRFRG